MYKDDQHLVTFDGKKTAWTYFFLLISDTYLHVNVVLESKPDV